MVSYLKISNYFLPFSEVHFSAKPFLKYFKNYTLMRVHSCRVLTVLPANSLTASDIKDENSDLFAQEQGQQFNLQNLDALC